MNKTENYAISEAYVRGYEDAQNDFDDMLAAATAWFEAPEYELAVALNKFKNTIGKA